MITNCPAGLRSGSVCLSPCTRYNTDQFCCRGAFGLPSTCVVSNWSSEAQTYVNNIHNFCPRQYSYAYDEVAGGALHTCATGINYTLTFCPSGGAVATPTSAPRATATPTTAARGTATPTSRARATATAGARATATPSGCAGVFTQGVDNVSATQARPWFRVCSGTASYVILHYVRPGLSQQNVQMTFNSGAGRWEFTVSGMAAGQVLQYQFTYNTGNQADSAWFTWTHP